MDSAYGYRDVDMTSQERSCHVKFAVLWEYPQMKRSVPVFRTTQGCKPSHWVDLTTANKVREPVNE